MAKHKPTNWLEVETVGDVAVGRFAQCRILHDDAVQEAGQQLLGLVDATGCRKVLLDLAGIEGMTTSFMSKLVALHQQVERGGGRLALCGVSPSLLEIFTICQFTRLVHIYPGEQKALESFEK
jgi:anti-sigma B factor antagonist